MTAKIEFMGASKKRFLSPDDSNTLIAAITATWGVPTGREVNHGQ
jgi:hypothetical protein